MAGAVRRSLRLVGAVTLGATTTLAIAWAAVLLPEEKPVSRVPCSVMTNRGPMQAQPLRRGAVLSFSIWPGPAPNPPFPRSCGTRHRFKAAEGRVSRSDYYVVGWPVRCLYMRDDRIATMSSSIRAGWWGGYPITSSARSRSRGYRYVLPYAPIWSGLAFNTGVWSGAWCLPLFGLPVLRRWRRGRRGLCVSCGYDLRGASGERCPECGVVIRRSHPQSP